MKNKVRLDLISKNALGILQGKVDRNIKRLKNPPRWLFPAGDEREYKKQMRAMVNGWEQAARDTIIAVLPAIINKANKNRPDLATNIDSIHNDGYSEDIEAAIKKYIGIVGGFSRRVKRSIIGMITGVDSFNKKQFGKITNSIFGIPLFQNEPWLKQELDSILSENTRLITKLSEDVRNDIQTTVDRGIRAGKRPETIAKEILAGTDLKKGIFAKAQTRARLIARDQVEKWNGQLTQLRQTEAGVEQYKWQTSMDERVRGNPSGKFPKARPTHWAMEGKVCSWSDPAIYKDKFEDKIWKKRSSIQGPLEHPGQPIRCRCTASPIMESIAGLE